MRPVIWVKTLLRFWRVSVDGDGGNLRISANLEFPKSLLQIYDAGN